MDAHRKVRHWYRASVFTNRYSGPVESTSARDYQDLQRWFADDLAEPGLIGEFRERFRSLDLRRETRRGTSVYNGIFNLIVLRGARDWLTGTSPRHDDLDDHHVVPKSWGKNKSLSTDTNRNAIKTGSRSGRLGRLAEPPKAGDSMTRPKDLKKRLLKDPEFREEYARADEEFALIETLIRARTAARLTQEELARRLGPRSQDWKAAAFRRPLPPCAATPKRPARG